ncbi:unnamed protein product [Dibothriocephalus latus]|uniref:Uncharacterized protein n=1 Tax=Dibothriocephalus latus TaxID=60516 RepID=A0A3P6QXG5_DIBLA|nr:unnamed protein product [Dibothriocephalus latus]
MQRLHNNKACGEDDIPVEIETLAPRRHKVIMQAWREEAVHDDWGSGILVAVRKKKDMKKRENYEGISLIDVAATIFATVLLRRFQFALDSRKWSNQTRLHAGRGCADQIFMLRCILEFRHS